MEGESESVVENVDSEANVSSPEQPEEEEEESEPDSVEMEDIIPMFMEWTYSDAYIWPDDLRTAFVEMTRDERRQLADTLTENGAVICMKTIRYNLCYGCRMRSCVGNSRKTSTETGYWNRKDLRSHFMDSHLWCTECEDNMFRIYDVKGREVDEDIYY